MKSLQEYLEERGGNSRAWGEMLQRSDRAASGGRAHTPREILQQPWVWRKQGRIVLEKHERLAPLLRNAGSLVMTGAGSSFLVGRSLEPTLRGLLSTPAQAIPTTDLTLGPEHYISSFDSLLMVSFSRSGASTESFEAIDAVRKRYPDSRHLLVTCNPEGELISHYSNEAWFESLALHPASCDEGLAMTSSFSSMVLATLLLARERAALETLVEALAEQGEALLQNSAETCQALLEDQAPRRVCLLGDLGLQGIAEEGALKILEMTDGRISTLADSFLGVRHGPLSFLDAETAIVALLSREPRLRHYEEGLLREISEKNLGCWRVALGPEVSSVEPFVDHAIETGGEPIRDGERMPLGVVFPQVLSLALSLRLGLNPDHPSPRGVINRVAQGVERFEESQGTDG